MGLKLAAVRIGRDIIKQLSNLIGNRRVPTSQKVTLARYIRSEFSQQLTCEVVYVVITGVCGKRRLNHATGPTGPLRCRSCVAHIDL